MNLKNFGYLYIPGLRSYGKVVYVFTLVPVFGTLVLCAKLLGLTPTGSIHQLFPETVWSEFFINGKSWMAASSEVFLTWGLFGAAAMQVYLYKKKIDLFTFFFAFSLSLPQISFSLYLSYYSIFR